MDVTSTESELRALMLASSDGDEAAYRTLLERLGGQLRAYHKRRSHSSLLRRRLSKATSEMSVQFASLARTTVSRNE